jgi:hypothetical protein
MGMKSQSDGDEKLCFGGGSDNHQSPPKTDKVKGVDE